MSTVAAVPSAPAAEGTFLGHPKGLFILFLTEMWERFSYYGMRSLLLLYMVNYLFIQPDVGRRVLGFNTMQHAFSALFHQDFAAQPMGSWIYGLYTGFVYFTPFFGGLLADRILGQRRTVVVGAILMSIGHFMMASERMFFPALITLILGNGCFKPNISTQVGLLYPPGDKRRDKAFSIFYVGINIGAFLAPLVCGTLGQSKLGWHWGFGAAGVGMVMGLIFYLMNQKYLAPDVLTQRQAAPVQKKEPLTREEWMRIGAICFACVLVGAFWSVYEQQGNTLQLWADQNTQLHFLGFTMPSTWYQAFNPFMIWFFTPALTWFWGRQAATGREPSSLRKMAIGLVLVALGFVVMIVAAQGMAPDAKRSILWLTGATAVFTLGELYLSPMGLSFVTKVAPARIVSMMMGVWFFSNAIGNYTTGYLGTFYEKMPKSQFFGLLTVIAMVAGVLLFILGRPLDKIVGKHDKQEAH